MIFISNSFSISANDVSKIFAVDTTHKCSKRADELRVYIKFLFVTLTVYVQYSVQYAFSSKYSVFLMHVAAVHKS